MLNLELNALLALLLLCAFVANAQLKTYVDLTSIKIGEELFYSIEAEIDSTTLVLFPEGQTFQPMEMIESYPIDSIKYYSLETHKEIWAHAI